MSVINTNITSMIGQSNLNKSQNALQTSMERLSSGLRINSAKDDAAGQAIANRMTASITGLAQAQRNANDGISIAQTAEGSLNQINDNLQRIRELTVQAQNGTNSASDIDSIQQEVNQRLEEIDRIARETDFNGTNVLNVTEETNISIQVGAKDGEMIDIKISDQNGWNLFNKDGGIPSEQVGGQDRKVAALGFDVRSAVVAGDGVAATPTADIDATVDGTATHVLDNAAGNASLVKDGNDQLFIKDTVAAVAEITFDADLSGVVHTTYGTANAVGRATDGNIYARFDDGGTPTYLQITEDPSAAGVFAQDFGTDSGVTTEPTGFAAFNADDVVVAAEPESSTYYAVTDDMVDAGVVTADLSGLTAVAAPESETPVDAEDTAVKVADGSAPAPTAPAEGGSGPLAELDAALAAVDAQRSELGAIQNRFEDAITNLNTNETNLAAARSRIEDADYAVEVANMTRAQILQQAGTSVLAQANQIPQNVLSLLG